MAAPIYIPTSSVGRFPLSTPSLAFIIGRLFDEGHFDQCEVISHCSFDLHCFDIQPCWASFHVPACDVKKCFYFILLLTALQFSQDHLLVKCFPTLYSYLFCHNIFGHKFMELFCGSLFYSIDINISFYAGNMLFLLL